MYREAFELILMNNGWRLSPTRSNVWHKDRKAVEIDEDLVMFSEAGKFVESMFNNEAFDSIRANKFIKG